MKQAAASIQLAKVHPYVKAMKCTIRSPDVALMIFSSAMPPLIHAIAAQLNIPSDTLYPPPLLC